MHHGISRRTFIVAAGAAGMALLGGCGGQGSGSAGASNAAASASSGAGGQHLVVGTLATEDILPYWVAAEEGLFDEAGLSVEIMPFQSATELIAGVSSGEVDLAMTDIMVTASMVAGGVDVQMVWVTLGAQPGEGRFGIMVDPESSVKSLTDLAGVPIGVGSNTILEYVMDRLMQDAGVPDDQIVVEELQKLPLRYQALVSGEVAAAALPGSLLALGEANGCRTVADDSTGDNLSQSVMIAHAAIADDAETLGKLEAVWDKAVALINENPEQYRSVLVQNANLSDQVADTYPISTYPTCKLPTASMVDPVLSWMEGKGYLTKPLSYDEATGKLS